MESCSMCVVGGVVTIVAILLTAKWLKSSSSKRRLEELRATYPKDTVILHQIIRGPFAPSASPFPMKLETFLRIAKVPYQNDFKHPMSAKGKTPWITLNGVDIADSQFAIEEIKKVFDIDMNSHLSPEQKAVGHFIRRTTDEALYWVLVCWRWQFGFEQEFEFMKLCFRDMVPIRSLVGVFLKMNLGSVAKKTYIQGTGRHSPEEIWEMAEDDLRSYSQILGDNHYMLGSQPSEVDACVFGMLAQIKWQWKENTPIKNSFDSFPNLSEWCDRMKDKFWPDWDDCITHGGTRVATK